MLYDRPPTHFRKISIEEKHDFFHRMRMEYPELAAQNSDSNELEATRFSYKDADGTVHLRDNRPAILVSSTSWTPDEDFSILLKALDRKSNSTNLCSHETSIYLNSHILCVQAMKRQQWTIVCIIHICFASSRAKGHKRPHTWAKLPHVISNILPLLHHG